MVKGIRQLNFKYADKQLADLQKGDREMIMNRL